MILPKFRQRYFWKYNCKHGLLIDEYGPKCFRQKFAQWISMEKILFPLRSCLEYFHIFQRRIQNPLKHLRWTLCKNSEGFKPLTFFAKYLIFDVGKGSEYASAFLIKRWLGVVIKIDSITVGFLEYGFSFFKIVNL